MCTGPYYFVRMVRKREMNDGHKIYITVSFIFVLKSYLSLMRENGCFSNASFRVGEIMKTQLTATKLVYMFLLIVRRFQFRLFVS